MRAQPLRIFISHPSHFLTDYKPHGDGLIASGLLRAVAQRGHTLHVAVALQDMQGALPANVHLHPLRLRSRFSRNDQGAAFRAEYALRVRALFRRLSREAPFDLIHQLNPVVTGLSALLFGLGTPVVLGPVWPGWQGPSQKHGLRSLLEERILDFQFRRAAAVLAPTPASRARLPEALSESGKVFSFPLGINSDAFLAARRSAPSRPTILFLANLQERKGIFTLLDAFEKVAAAMPRALLRIAGTGGQAEQVRQRVESSPVRGQMEMLGNVPREEIAGTLAGCTVYCLPSYGEPYGMSALEAMAAGKPLVVTDAGGLRHLVPNGGSLKVAPRDAEALSAALLHLLQDSALQTRMGEYNLQHVAQYHEWARVADRLESVYDAVLPSTPPQTSPLFSRRLTEPGL